MTAPRRLLIIAAPALLMAVLVAVIAQDAPRLDEWDTPGEVLRDLARDQLSLSGLVKQHNESRKLIPRLFFLALAPVFGWSPRAAMALTLVITALLAALLIRALPKTDQGRIAPALILTLLLFHPLRADHFLSALGLNGALVFISLVLSARWHLGQAGSHRLWPVGAALSLLASLSFASGLGLWILSLPLARLWLCPEEKKARVWLETGLHLLLMALFFALYFGDYERPGHHPSWGDALSAPLRFTGFFTAWLGAPFVLGRSLSGAILAGLIQLAALLFLLRRAYPGLRTDPERRRALWPWLMLCAYALGAALMVSLGRSPWGLDQALPSRYFVQSLWLPIGLFGLARQIFLKDSETSPWLMKVAVAALILSWSAGAPLLWDHFFTQRQTRLTLSMIDEAPDDPMLARVTPIPRAELQAHLADLRAGGFFEVAPPSLPLSDLETEPAGHLFISVTKEGWSLIGWGVNPRRGGPADLILLYRRSTKVPVTALIPRRWRPDVAEARRTWRAITAGVAERFEGPPPALEDLAAAAVDLETGEAFPLKLEGP